MDRLTGQAWEVMYVNAEEEGKMGTEKLSKETSAVPYAW